MKPPFVDTPENREKLRREIVDEVMKNYKKNPPTPKEFVTNYVCQGINMTDDQRDQTILFLAISCDPNCSLAPGDYKFSRPIELTRDKKCDGYTVRDGDRKIEIQPHCYIENIHLTVTLNKPENWNGL